MEFPVYILGAEVTSKNILSYDNLDQYFLENLPTDNVNLENHFEDYFGLRFIKKIDRSVQYSIFTAENLLKKVNVLDSNMETGLILGNNYGGWAYVEDQMYDLYKQEPDAINPYVATAWFPAAAQGEISIRNKLFGQSKTFSADQLSSALAIEHGIDLLKSNKLKYAIVGGYESLISPLIKESLEANDLVGDQYPPSEAASKLLLTMERPLSDTIISIKYMDKRNSLDEILNNLKTSFEINQIDYCMLPPLNMTHINKELIKQEMKTLKSYKKELTIGMPTFSFGEISAASYALQVVTGFWMLEKQKVPVSHSIDCIEELQSTFVNGIGILANLLIIGRNYDADQYFCLVLSKEQ